MKLDWSSGLKNILSVLAIAFLLTAFAFGQRMSPISLSPSLDGLRAKNIKVKTLQGKSIELNSLLGQGKPVILNIWATWCGPCRQEIPHLVDIAKAYRKTGLIVIGLTYENFKELKKVNDVVSEYSIDYEVAFTPLSLYYYFNKSESTISLPQTMVFHANGTMVKHFVGYDGSDYKNALENAISLALRPER